MPGPQVGVGTIPSEALRALIDGAQNVRTQEEVRKRDNWLSRLSVAHYEKSGRLAATGQKLDTDTQLACRAAERYIEEIMLGQAYPVIPLRCP